MRGYLESLCGALKELLGARVATVPQSSSKPDDVSGWSDKDLEEFFKLAYQVWACSTVPDGHCHACLGRRGCVSELAGCWRAHRVRRCQTLHGPGAHFAAGRHTQPCMVESGTPGDPARCSRPRSD